MKGIEEGLQRKGTETGQNGEVSYKLSKTEKKQTRADNKRFGEKGHRNAEQDTKKY